MFGKVAFKLDALGLRRPVAALASLAYSGQDFSVDADGHWVNRQPECTIVSPTIHTAKFASFRSIILDHWAYCYTPTAGDIIVDLGAGVGEEAVVFSPMVGAAGRIYSIEAMPDTFRCLEQTVARSGLGNVTPLFCAVAGADGVAEISDGPVHLANSILAGGTVKVPQRSLDSLVAEWGIDRIDLLRLNIEGAEKLAVEGMGQCIARVRNMAVSCHDFCGLPSKAIVHAFLEKSGFTVTTRQAGPNSPWLGDYLYARR